MNRQVIAYLGAAFAVAAVTWLTSAHLASIGIASSALLFLLPVLFSSALGGVGPGMLAALAGTVAYTYFLLPPRFTFHIHGFDNTVSFVVLAAVAVVTSRLAALLRQSEAEARASAVASAEEAELSALLGKGEQDTAIDRGLEWIAERYGPARLLPGNAGQGADEDDRDGGALAPLDQSAAAWARHNGDMTGHGTQIMAGSDWTFLPLARRIGKDSDLLALARPVAPSSRSEPELHHLQRLAILLGHASNRLALEQARRERERLEETDTMRRALIASLGHDLRTPLTVITGRLEALAPVAPEAGEALAAARRLHGMMENLIGAARIEEGSLNPAIESLDIVDAVSAASDQLGDGGAIGCERSIPPDLPFVRADPVLFHHILLNLLGNARRHARSAIRIAAWREGDRIVLSVGDDGPGIAQEDHDKIFERFARITGSDRKSGSGLGLAIVKGFAEAMDMTVAVSDSTLGGACFALSMPAARELEA